MTQLSVISTQQKKSSPLISQGILQRKCACGKHAGNGGECAECKKKRENHLQRSAVNVFPGNEVPPVVHQVLQSPGQPLDGRTQAFMAPRFGHDFNQVRVHTGARAAESARAVNARAYTVGQNVVFGEGQFDRDSVSGQRLMAHELAHVVQQRHLGRAAKQNAPIHPETSVGLEQEADRAAESVLAGESVHLSGGQGGTLQRQAAGNPTTPAPSF